MVSRAVAAAAILKDKGVSTRILNATFIAPLDVASIVKAASETNAIVTVEEANIAGGLGAAVASVVLGLTADSRVPLKIIGTDDWSPTLSTEALYTHFGLTAENIAAAAEEVLARD
jgi:transketolase